MKRINVNQEVFEDGQLCYVVKRKYKGKGKPVLIMHEARLVDKEGAFGYGTGKAWLAKVVSVKDTK